MILPPGHGSSHLIFGMLFLLSNRLQTIGDTFFQEITTKQWFILLVLNILSDREPTLNEVSDLAGSSRQNVKQIILKLEKKGFVELNKDKADARKFRIRMTPKCKEFEQAYSKQNKIFMDQLYQNLKPQELDTTAKTLLVLQKNLEGMKKQYVK